MRLYGILVFVCAVALAGCVNRSRVLVSGDDSAGPVTVVDTGDGVIICPGDRLPADSAPSVPAPDEAPPADAPAVAEEPPPVVPQDVPVEPPAEAPRYVRCAPDPCARPVQHDPCCKSGRYVGGIFSLGPGVGGGGEIGIPIKCRRCDVLSLELSYQHQDLWEEWFEETQTGKFNMVGLGVRLLMDRCSARHATVRAGITWFQASGTPSEVDYAHIPIRDDYVGVYAGIGYLWDFGSRWSHGPEARVYLGYGLGAGEWAVAPSIMWRINYDF